jgi:hypothetical protein
MSLLVFQNSRRQLLSTLMETIDAARAHRELHKKNGKPENDAEGRRINNLLKAVEAADAECKKLEYWSDIKKLAEEGAAGHATDPNAGWNEKWQGVDASGSSESSGTDRVAIRRKVGGGRATSLVLLWVRSRGQDVIDTPAKLPIHVELRMHSYRWSYIH